MPSPTRSTSCSSSTVVAGRYNPSVVAESLPSFLNEIIASAGMRDWQAIADELITEAREVDGEV